MGILRSLLVDDTGKWSNQTHSNGYSTRVALYHINIFHTSNVNNMYMYVPAELQIHPRKGGTWAAHVVYLVFEETKKLHH